MRAFRDRPIRQKVGILIALASMGGVALAAAAVTIYDLTTFRPRAVSDVTTLGAIVRTNTVPALLFDDSAAARENLATLRSRAEIGAAAVYRPDGSLFASYRRAGAPPLLAPPPADSGLVVQGDELVLTLPVASDDQPLGWLRLQYRLPTFWQRLPPYAIVVVVVLIAVGATAILLLAALGRSVATPLLGLADTVRRLTATRDLTLRVPAHADDEIGALTDGFNRMLDTLQERDAAVQERAAALRESEARLRLALGAASMRTWVLPLGPTIDEAALGTLLEGANPDDAARVRQAIAQAISDRGSVETEFRRTGPDGEEREIAIRGHAYLDAPGTPGQLIGVLQDVTDRRKLERQLMQAQKMEAIGNLAGGIAHDFNNLLTGMLGYVRFAQRRLPEGTQVRSDLDQVERAARRAASLTSQLLSYARRQMVLPTLVNLNEAVRALEPLLRRILGEDMTIEVRLAPSLPPTRVDPGQLEQVLVNLAVNARDAMPVGGRLEITTREIELAPAEAARRELVPGAYVELAVADTGTGIAPDIMNRIFEPFFTTKPVGQGTGLGLAMCYGIVKQAEGEILVESELGHGATFRVLLPVATEETEPARPEAGGGSMQGRGTVLLAEDDAAVRALAARTLREAGYHVLEADDGGAARVLAAEHAAEIDLLITDVTMPVASGPELVQALRTRRPSVPVLLISGYAADAVSGRGALEKDALCLAKPFTPDELLAAARGAVDASRPATA
ncbi:MAG TPA: ATP-binding protein [Gemmatimonadales bacterium]|nr:ATP-binding protein [Gemmatimonadales bacterium]